MLESFEDTIFDNFRITWIKDRDFVKKYFNENTNIYFDKETIPRLININNPKYTFGIAIDNEDRAIGGIVVGFNGHGENVYKKPQELPYIYELCACSQEGIGENNKVAQPCSYAQKGVGTALVKDFAEKVDYHFYFTCADWKIATPFWRGITDRIKNIKLTRIDTTAWGTPVFEAEKVLEKN